MSVLYTGIGKRNTIEHLVFLVENLFTKRQVCLSCNCELRSGERYCSRCRSAEAKQLANIYDVDLSLSFSRMLDFLSPSIDAYRDRFLNCPRDESTNDIPYNKNYRLLLDSTNQPFISIIIHLDGISLSRSSNQPLWLLSCSIVELPPHLRVRRHNMPVLSVWIAQEEPSMEVWLRDILSQLQVLKERG